MSGSEDVKPTVYDPEDWVRRWDDGAIGFHKERIHPFLAKYLTTLQDGRTNVKIFVPLCGKAWDIKYLADQGCTVYGVEVAAKALEDFFAEQKVPYTTQPAPEVDGTLYQSEDRKIQLYCCDFFKFSKDVAGEMDAVFDRASMVAINRGDRERYVRVMKALMAPGCRYLLDAVSYDGNFYPGPPHNLPDAVVASLFGSVGCTVSKLESMDAFEERHKKWGISSFDETAFLISPK